MEVQLGARCTYRGVAGWVVRSRAPSPDGPRWNLFRHRGRRSGHLSSWEQAAAVPSGALTDLELPVFEMGAEVTVGVYRWRGEVVAVHDEGGRTLYTVEGVKDEVVSGVNRGRRRVHVGPESLNI